VGVQKLYFLDLQFKSYGCLKFLGQLRAARANQKKFLFLNFIGLDFFHRFLSKFLNVHQLENFLRLIKITREMLKDQLHLCKSQFEKM
jgi:hypothetical protein